AQTGGRWRELDAVRNRGAWHGPLRVAVEIEHDQLVLQLFIVGDEHERELAPAAGDRGRHLAGEAASPQLLLRADVGDQALRSTPTVSGSVPSKHSATSPSSPSESVEAWVSPSSSKPASRWS